MTAGELRRAFVDFFVARGHTEVPSAGLIPHDPSILFTVAGMVPFKPYFLGDETPPFRRATSVQKCMRAGGKHNDLDDIGRTNRHFSFFEMLGNFSFGDYFKAEAIPWAWELVTEVLRLPPDRLWVTVHDTDDEAEKIWRDEVGVPAARVQRMGDDNFWRMADTGPCGPSSEIFLDLGPEAGPDGGPAHGGEDRYLEFWNLVFMQYDARPDGTTVPLPRPSVDTGAGLERILSILQGRDSVWEIDVFAPLIAAASEVTGVAYRHGEGGESDVSLRIVAEHGRAMTFLVSDGVVPSNEERGYVLRRIIRRAVRHAYRLGVTGSATPALVEATVEVMGDAYPELRRDRDQVLAVVTREEERFRGTLDRGVAMLDGVTASGDVSGDDAFFLHDTLGFPIDLTREIAAERGRVVDLDGFGVLMEDQRRRAREAGRAGSAGRDAAVDVYRDILDAGGATEFTGRAEPETTGAKVLGLVVAGERVGQVGEGAAVDVVLDRTPFYAEAGGQVGDTGTLESGDGRTVVQVLDTVYGLPGTVVVHRGEVVRGELAESDSVTARIDAERRDRIRRNHTATHLLHWALREVLGPHVKQAGSLVAPDRLRFDFSHHQALTRDELDAVEALANAEVITDAPVRHYETSKDHAASLGAIAFFGDKYGDVVRVLEAGPHSIELCGGTHVHALGFIGPVKIVSEGSIGSNLRRIEAVTGPAALERIHDEELRLRELADLLKTTPDEVGAQVERLLGRVRSLTDELDAARSSQAGAEAAELAARAEGGVVVARRDGLDPGELRRLAAAVRDRVGSGVVVLAGAGPGGTKAGLSVAVSADHVSRGVSAAEIARAPASLLGGGTAKNAELVVGGGPRVENVDEALRVARAAAAEVVASAP